MSVEVLTLLMYMGGSALFLVASGLSLAARLGLAR